MVQHNLQETPQHGSPSHPLTLRMQVCYNLCDNGANTNFGTQHSDEVRIHRLLLPHADGNGHITHITNLVVALELIQLTNGNGTDPSLLRPTVFRNETYCSRLRRTRSPNGIDFSLLS